MLIMDYLLGKRSNKDWLRNMHCLTIFGMEDKAWMKSLTQIMICLK